MSSWFYDYFAIDTGCRSSDFVRSTISLSLSVSLSLSLSLSQTKKRVLFDLSGKDGSDFDNRLRPGSRMRTLCF